MTLSCKNLFVLLLIYIYVNLFRDFGDIHSNAIDESWYKGAVLQHKIEPDSFVYTMAEENKHRRILGSQAIFPRDAGHEAPGCVVGFKFRHSRLNKRFNSIIKMNTAIVSIRTQK